MLVGGALLVGALVATVTLWERRPLDAATIASAQQQANEESQRRFVQRDYRRCLETPEEWFGPGATAAECEEVLPQASWFLPRAELDPVDLADEIPLQLGLFVGVIAVLIGATMIGAEWSAGSVGTQLLFEPRRPRVWAAKAGAIAITTAALAGVIFALVWAVILVAHASWTGGGLPASFLSDLSLTGLRVAAFAAVGGLAGYAVTMAVRHTVVVVGLMLAYAVIGEGLLRSFFSGVERYLVSNNALALIQKSHTVEIYPEDGCFDEASCQPFEIHFDLVDATTYFGVLVAVMLALSLYIFNTRDVP